MFLRGNVAEDVIVMGGNVHLIGSVGGDIRAVGGRITLSGHVGGDLVAAGGRVHVLSGATVGGDVVVAGGRVAVDGVVSGNLGAAGGEVDLNNAVSGNVQVRAASLTVGENARIGGGLTYWAPTEAAIHKDATIAGPVTFHPVSAIDREPLRRALLGFGIATALALFLMILVAGLLGFLAFREKSEEMVRHTLRHFGRELLLGFVLLIVIPVALFLTAVTVVGLPVAALGGLLYCGFGIVAVVYAGIVFGSLLSKLLWKQGDYRVTWKTVVGGIALLSLVRLVPILGGLVYAVFTLAVFGSLFYFFYRRFWLGRRAAL